MKPRRVNVEGMARLPQFSQAVIADNTIYVAGMLGVAGEELAVVDGGVKPETIQALRNIERVLEECGATLDDVVKVNVYLTDMSLFGEMNDAYATVFGDQPPARITVGCSALALGALVEMDCIAVRP
jgi:2-iminobutanoate/2-iminopropanoate deaminase